jgi:hypothetical protein
LTAHAVDADQRRYALAEEACRHYIDIDHYELAPPIDTIPHRWKDAVSKYSVDTLNAYGIVPWHIHLMSIRLTEAFKAKDVSRILKLSADIGHYIADAHVPLHTTQNYNGQLSNQLGIHAFWESRLPELFSDNYNLFVGRAQYIDQVQAAAWVAVEQSFSALDSVLSFEKQLSQTYPEDQKYILEQKGRTMARTYAPEYAGKYHEMLNDQVERRLRGAALMVASVWYTAWVDAGQPKLTNELLVPESTEPKDSIPASKDGKMMGRPEE